MVAAATPLIESTPARLDQFVRGLCVVVVDADADVAERVAAALRVGDGPARVFAADSRDAAVRRLESLRRAGRDVELVLIDRSLDGAAVRGAMAQFHPEARRVVTCAAPSLDAGLDALRRGALDYLTKPLPDDAEVLRQRLAVAGGHRYRDLHVARRLRRLKSAVRGLNRARRTVGKKVDLLCSDLVEAYGDLSKKVQEVRVVDDLRRLLGAADDVETLLCHTMDWTLRRLGNCNIALFLTDDQERAELGAYMKYTVAGGEPLTQWLGEHVVPLAGEDGYATGDNKLFGGLTRHLADDAAAAAMLGQAVAVVDARYLGESLATWVVFRRADKPFGEEEAEVLKAGANVFATALANLCNDDCDEDDDRGLDLFGGGDDGGHGGHGDRGLGELL